MASPVPIPEPGRNQQQSTAQPTSEAIGVTSPELQLAQYYVRFASKNETAGPFAGLAIRNMIQNRYLGITDMICEVDHSNWTVLSESREFGSLAVAATTRAQLEGATCPNCQAHMAVILKGSTGATILIWTGSPSRKIG